MLIKNWNNTEVRYLGLGAMKTLAVSGLLVAWWCGPLSPVVLDRPAMQVAKGDFEEAIVDYKQVAHGWGTDSVREEASWRAAQTSAIATTDTHRTLGLLREFLSEWPNSNWASEANALLADQYQVALSDMGRAADSFRTAAQMDPDHMQAGDWWLRAGEAYWAMGKRAEAASAFESATPFPDVAGRAWLALGRIHLKDDPSLAYEDFGMALDHANTDSGRSLARLGAVTALERLQKWHAALAELDAAIEDGDQDIAIVRRRHRMRAAYQMHEGG